MNSLKLKLSPGCPWQTRVLACKYPSTCLCFTDICGIYQLTFWKVLLLASCANWLICSYVLRTWGKDHVLRGIHDELRCAWCWVAIFRCALTSFVFCSFVTFPSISDVQSIATWVARVSECHVLWIPVPANLIPQVISKTPMYYYLFVGIFSKFRFECFARSRQDLPEGLFRLECVGSNL